ncbi:MAG: hypothetical protein MJA31_07335 [Clostridia bacterium]|nr:hypothetical protein [Clostridia bacterium]
MNINQIKRRLDIAINTLRVNDNYLLKYDVCERSIAHRLAIYLENTFGHSYDVDCEYNKNIEHNSGLKKIEMIHSKWRELFPNNGISRQQYEEDIMIEKIVHPDIVIHRRGRNDHNLLVVEIKKSSSCISEEFDDIKLKSYTNPNYDEGLQYKYGVFIKFFVNQDRFVQPEIYLYQNGERIQ